MLLLVTLVTLVAGLLAVPSAEAQLCPGLNSPLRAVGFESVTVGETAVGLTIPASAEMAMGVLETSPVRYRDDGTNPTATVGVLVATGSTVVICSRSLTPIKFIRSDASDGTLQVMYYGR